MKRIRSRKNCIGLENRIWITLRVLAFTTQSYELREEGQKILCNIGHIKCGNSRRLKGTLALINFLPLWVLALVKV